MSSLVTNDNIKCYYLLIIIDGRLLCQCIKSDKDVTLITPSTESVSKNEVEIINSLIFKYKIKIHSIVKYHRYNHFKADVNYGIFIIINPAFSYFGTRTLITIDPFNTHIKHGFKLMGFFKKIREKKYKIYYHIRGIPIPNNLSH